MVYGRDDRGVLQLDGLPLLEPGGGADGAQHHPQGGPHHGAVVQGQVVAQVPGQVVPKTPMEHDLRRETPRMLKVMIIKAKKLKT